MSDQLSLDLGDVQPAKRRRRVPAWQVEAGRLKGWQERRRRADDERWLVAECWPHYDASFAKLKTILARERAERTAPLIRGATGGTPGKPAERRHGPRPGSPAQANGRTP